MTFWAKLLTVIVLVLSIAFAAMSGAVFGKRENFRGQLEAEKQAHAFDKSKDKDTIAGLESNLELREAELANAQTQLTAQERDLLSLKDEVDQSRIEVADYKARAEASDDIHQQVAASLDATNRQNLALIADNEKYAKENRELIANLSSERERANELETLNASLVTERDGLKVALASANETISIHEEAFTVLAKRYVEVWPTIQEIIRVPQIRGLVASVDEETNIVILNVGADDGVRKNFPFTVWRGDSFVATINVFEIYDNYSVAQVSDSKLEIKLGDNAWTRLY